MSTSGGPQDDRVREFPRPDSSSPHVPKGEIRPQEEGLSTGAVDDGLGFTVKELLDSLKSMMCCFFLVEAALMGMNMTTPTELLCRAGRVGSICAAITGLGFIALMLCFMLYITKKVQLVRRDVRMVRFLLQCKWGFLMFAVLLVLANFVMSVMICDPKSKSCHLVCDSGKEVVRTMKCDSKGSFSSA